MGLPKMLKVAYNMGSYNELYDPKFKSQASKFLVSSNIFTVALMT